jgi:hypothetical protein
VQVYNVVIHSDSSLEKEILAEFSNKIKVLLFFFEKFFPKYLNKNIESLRHYNALMSQKTPEDEEKVFLHRLRIIEQLILAHYLVEYVQIGSFNETNEQKYAREFNINISEINNLIEHTYFHRPAKEIVKLLKYDDALKVSGGLPKGRQLSKFNRQAIRLVGSIEKKIQSSLRLKTKSALGAFIDKNNYLRFLINHARTGAPVTFSAKTEWYDEIVEAATKVFTNTANNFSDEELIELLLKANSNLEVYNNIYNEINKKTLDQFLNSNYEERRIGKSFFKGKLNYKKDKNIQLRKNTAENFFTNELRIRNLFKYYNNYYSTYEF